MNEPRPRQSIQTSPGQMGCAFLDNQKNPSDGGWFSIDGGRIDRFSSIMELPPDVAFVTNVSYAAYGGAFGLIKTANIRQNFFRPSFESLAREIGYSTETWPIKSALPEMSAALSRAWSFSRRSWPKIRLCGTLRESIYSAMLVSDQPVFGLRDEILSSAWQSDSVVQSGGHVEAGSRVVRLIPNRVRHAHSVLSIGMPRGEYFISNASGMTVERALNSYEPMFLECEVDFDGAALAPLCAFGSQTIQGGSMRAWVSQPELEMLSRFSRSVSIRRSMVWEDFIDSPQLTPEFLSDPMMSLSYSAGLVAESLLDALTSRQYSKTSRRYYIPPRAAWLKSIDRTLSFAAAKKVQDCGFRVLRYEYGAVYVTAMPSQHDELLAVAADCGFMIADIIVLKDQF